MKIIKQAFFGLILVSVASLASSEIIIIHGPIATPIETDGAGSGGSPGLPFPEPGELTIDNYSGSEFVVSWGDLADGYQYLELIEEGPTGTRIIGVSGSSHTVSGRVEGEYHYRLEGKACGISGPEFGDPEVCISVDLGIKTVYVDYPAIAPEPAIVSGSSDVTIPFSPKVSARGALTVDVPIELPKGPNGIGPNLSLNYVSAASSIKNPNYAGQMRLDHGWRLKGIEGITRKTASWGTVSGTLTGTSYSVENPDQTVAPAGQTYRSGQDIASRLVKQEDPSGNPWFIMQRGGKNYRYGMNADGREEGSYGPKLWLLQEYEDEFGNKVRVEYETFNSLNESVKAPTFISYGNHSIEFVYHQEVEGLPAGSYFGESNSMVLNRLRILTDNKVVREYRFKRNEGLGLDAITQIQKCGFDEDGVSPTCTMPLDIDGGSVTKPGTATRVRYITSISDGVGLPYQVNYTSSNDYQPLTESQLPWGFDTSPEQDCSTNMPGSGSSYPVSIVTSVSYDNGTGSHSTTNYDYCAKSSSTVVRKALPDSTYEYSTKWAQSSEVFAAIQNFFGQSGRVTKHARFSGEVGVSGAVLLEYSEVELQMYSINDIYLGISDIPIFSYPLPVSRKTHRLDEDGWIIGGSYTEIDYSWDADNGVIHSKTETTRTGYDSSVSGESIESPERTTVSATNYSNDLNNWIVGFVQSKQTDVSVPGRTGSRGTRVERTPIAGLNTHKISSQSVYADDGSGYVLKRTSATNYNNEGNPTSVSVSGSDFQTRTNNILGYIDNQYVQSTSRPLGSGYSENSSFTYDKRFGSVKTAHDQNNNLTSRTDRDNFGRVIKETHPDGTEISIGYQACSGNCGSARTFDGGSPAYKVTTTTSHPLESLKGAPTTVAYYDTLGRVIREEVEGFSSGEWIAVDTVYNHLGELEKESLPYKVQASASPAYSDYDYDLKGRLVSVTRPDGGSTSTVYQQLANQYEVIQSNNIVGPGGNKTQTRKEEYNSLGQLTRSFDAFGSTDEVVTDYQYDQTGSNDWVRINGDDNTIVTTGHDAAGNLLMIDDPNTGLTTFEYDGLGQLRYQTDARGIVTRLDYDLAGRTYQRIDDLGGVNQTTNSWTFDTKMVGYLSSRSSNSFTEEYFYDNNGNIYRTDTDINVTGLTDAFSVSRTHDSYGRVKTESYPSGLVTRTDYNARGYAVALYDNRDNQLISRLDGTDAFGNATQKTLGNGLQTTRAYDPNSGRITAIQTGSGGAIQNHTYQWWSNGSLQQRVNQMQGATETFTYDGLNRLTDASTATSSASRQLSYGYDALGNLTGKSGDDTLSGHDYSDDNRPHRLNSVTVNGVTHTYTYDPSGNITQDDAPGVDDDRHITFNAIGKPVAIVKGDAANPVAKDEFTYGPDGARFYKATLNNTPATPVLDQTVYLYGGTVEIVLPGSGSTTTIEKTYLGDAIHYRDVTLSGASERFEYVHTDHLGSVTAMTDETGNPVVNQAFDPFGGYRTADWLSGGAPTPLEQLMQSARGFTGHEHLGTGLIHMNGRVYDPTLGRFMSADPIVQAPTYSQSYNRYAYVFNDPLSLTDPSGYFGAGVNCDVEPNDADCRGKEPPARQHAERLPPMTINGQRPDSGGMGSPIGLGGWSRTGGAYYNYDNLYELSRLIRSRLEDGDFGTAFKLEQTYQKALNLIESDGEDEGSEKIVSANEWAIFAALFMRRVPVIKGAKPANFSPSGASRSGAFNEAKRQSGIPTSQQPSRVLKNIDKRANPQPGRIYEYEVPAPGGGTRTVRIRDDAGGHDFGPGNAQNRGPHFNDEAGNHYDY